MQSEAIPVCPRCSDGGRVKLIDEQHDSGIFTPDRPLGKTLVYRCECGWATTVRLNAALQQFSTDSVAWVGFR